MSNGTMRHLISSAGTVSGRAALSYGGGAITPPIHDGRRYTTFSQSGKEIYLRDHPLFRSGLTSLMGGFRDEREWRSVGADAEVITAGKDLDATVFGPGWTLRTHPSRAGYPAAIRLHRFVTAWLSAIRLQLLHLFPAIARADLTGWSIVEVQRAQHFMFEGRPYDVPMGFREHVETEYFAVATDGSLVFQDTDRDQAFPAPDGERFICNVKGIGGPYGTRPTGGELWFLWQLKRSHEKEQARGIRQSITGTPLFDAKDLTDPGATEGEVQVAEDALRANLELVAQLAEETGILVTIGGLEYKEVVTAGKAADWLDLLKGINDAMRRIIIGETLTAQDASTSGNRAAGDGARVSRLDRARMYGSPPEAVIQEQLIRHCCEWNFPGVDPQDIPLLQLRALHPVSREYIDGFLSHEGAEVDGDWLAEAWDIQLPSAGTRRILRGGARQPSPSPGDPFASSPDPRRLPGQGSVEGVQLDRLPQRTAIRARAERTLQEDAEAIEAGADAIEAQGSEDLERALATRMRQLRNEVQRTADPETGSPLL